jgi:hypothetical protein
VHISISISDIDSLNYKVSTLVLYQYLNVSHTHFRKGSYFDSQQVRVPHAANQNFDQELLNAPARNAIAKLLTWLCLLNLAIPQYQITSLSQLVTHSYRATTAQHHRHHSSHQSTSHRLTSKHHPLNRKSQTTSHDNSRTTNPPTQTNTTTPPQCQEAEAAGAAAAERTT